MCMRAIFYFRQDSPLRKYQIARYRQATFRRALGLLEKLLHGRYFYPQAMLSRESFLGNVGLDGTQLFLWLHLVKQLH